MTDRHPRDRALKRVLATRARQPFPDERTRLDRLGRRGQPAQARPVAASPLAVAARERSAASARGSRPSKAARRLRRRGRFPTTRSEGAPPARWRTPMPGGGPGREWSPIACVGQAAGVWERTWNTISLRRSGGTTVQPQVLSARGSDYWRADPADRPNFGRRVFRRAPTRAMHAGMPETGIAGLA